MSEPSPTGVEFLRRRRARNWAILAALIGLVVLFYFVSVARLLRG
jgi:hypothetical protein